MKRIAVVFTIITPVAALLAWAGTAQGLSESRVATAVADKLVNRHLASRPLDDHMSERWLGRFIDSLDPLKMYFLKSDVAQLSESRYDLDDAVKRGDVSFAHRAFGLLKKRVGERQATIDSVLAKPFNLKKKEFVPIDYDDVSYAESARDVRDRWRKRIKYDFLREKGDGGTDKEIRDKLRRRYHRYSKYVEQTTSEEVFEMYLTSLTTSYDPHSTYLSPDTLKDFQISMQLQLDGIGALLQNDDGVTVVKKIVPGGAAARDGRLKPDDQIVAVGQGTKGTFDDVVDMPLNHVVKRIRGKRGTIVRLRVIPGGKGTGKIYALTRDKVEVKDSEAKGEVVEFGKQANGQPYKLGVINLPSFYADLRGASRRSKNYKSSTRDVMGILSDLRRQGVDAIMMDLRDNGGGSLSEAVQMTGLFIDRGPVVQVKDSDGRVESLRDPIPGAVWDGPLVVLTSRLSASASEIFAGAIQDYGRGLLVGDSRTFGKGTVQVVEDLHGDMGALKYTIQQFYLPDGASTQARGVVPDVSLPSIISVMDVGETEMDYALAFDRIRAASFTRAGLVDAALIQRLNNRSKERRSKSKEFSALDANIKRYLKQKGRKQAPLNEVAFNAERAALDAEQERFKKLQEQRDKGVVVVKNFYFNELASITADYIEAIKGRPRVTQAR